ncbi:MAG: flavin reductase family protein [Desulfobacteraceae bacterium]|jgi:flavin reductase (DIM6/NTAB) family NADH-FMN oxidoreductase RutF
MAEPPKKTRVKTGRRGRPGASPPQGPDRRRDPKAAPGPTPKQAWKPGNLLAPIPAVLVSCGGLEGWQANLITIAWTGSVCSDPVMLSIAVRPERHSHAIIRATGEFVVNLPSVRQVRAVDWCGMVSGRSVDKFAATGLTPEAALVVRCAVVRECPLNIECRVREALTLGSHTLFLAEVLAVQVDPGLLDGKGRLCLERAGLLAFGHGEYFALGRSLGRFGFSVRRRGRRA